MPLLQPIDDYRPHDHDTGGPGPLRVATQLVLVAAVAVAVLLGVRHLTVNPPDRATPEAVAATGTNSDGSIVYLSDGSTLVRDPSVTFAATNPSAAATAAATPTGPGSLSGVVITDPGGATGGDVRLAAPTAPDVTPLHTNDPAPPASNRRGDRSSSGPLTVNDPVTTTPVLGRPDDGGGTTTGPHTSNPAPGAGTNPDTVDVVAGPGPESTIKLASWQGTCTGGDGSWGFTWAIHFADGAVVRRSLNVAAGASGEISSDSVYGALPNTLRYSTTSGTCSAGG